MGETMAAATGSNISPGATPTVSGRSSLADRAQALTRSAWAPDLFGLAITCGASLLIAVIAMRLWDSSDLRVPIDVHGDSPSLLSTFKQIHEHGWVWTNPSLGAPFGNQVYDYGSVGPDNLHWALAWVLTRFASQPGTVYNAILLLSFPMSAATAYASLRWLDVGRIAAVVAATAFATAPYHFARALGPGHLLLADTAAVPFAVYLAVAIVMRKPLWRRRNHGPRLTRWLSGTSLRTFAVCVVVASSGIYYAGFALLFIVAAMVAARIAHDDGNYTLRNGGAVLLAFGGVLAFNLLPTIIYHRLHGSNAATGQRSPDESIVYGLNLIGQVLPPPTHRLGLFSTLGNQYWGETSSASEGPTWGGTLSVIGLVLVFASLLASLVGTTGTRWVADARLRAVALITVVAALLGATGAGGAFIAFIINPSLRAWNRIGIVLVFCGLFALALALDALWARARTAGRRGAVGFVAFAGVLIVFVGWDQTTPSMKPDYEGARQTWSADAHFDQAIKASLGGRGEVYQMPYLAYPESAPIHDMPDYSPLSGYLHSPPSIKWSYGAMKGRPEDWQQQASELSAAEQITAVAAAGFDGLWIDTSGYTDPENEILAPARAATGIDQPLRSADGHLAYFDLQPLEKRLATETPPARLQAAGRDITHPLDVAYGDGFYPSEQAAGHTRRWAKTRASLTIDNPSKTPRRISLSARLGSLRPAHVQIILDGRQIATARSTRLPGRRFEQVLTTGPGKHTVTFVTDAPVVTLPDETRDLRLQFYDLTVEDEAVAQLPVADRD